MTRPWRCVGRSVRDSLVPKSRDYARSAEISTLSEVIIGCYVKLWVQNSPNIILQSSMDRFSRIIRSILRGEMLTLEGGGGAMPRPGHVWWSWPMNSLADIPRGMYEMLEVSWVTFC